MKIAQCWDDGVTNDIRLTELFRQYHAKATFNLNPGLMPEHTEKPTWLTPENRVWNHQGFCCGRIGRREMHDIYKDFKVASHCWGHQMAGSLPDEEFLKAALEARKFLEDLFQKDCPGFAWPNGIATPETCRLLRENGFKYGRMVQNATDVTDCADTMMLRSSCHFMHPRFFDLYDEAKKAGRQVFYFWGHSYEMLQDESLWHQMELKLQYISQDPEAEWIDVEDIVPLCKAK